MKNRHQYSFFEPAPVIIQHPRFRRCVEQNCLEPVEVNDLKVVVSLAKKAFAGTEFLPWVVATLEFHAKCLQLSIDDGRQLFKLIESGEIIGVCGIHKYIWGPESICWSSWFFIDPIKKNTTTGYRLAVGLLSCARRMGFRTMYVETSANDPNYSVISSFMERFGFRLHSRIADYYNLGSDMLIYSINP